MFTTLIALATPRNLKLAGLALAVIAAVWWHQHAVTVAYRHGATDRERTVLADEAERIELAVKAKTDELATREHELSVRQSSLAAERTTINQTRDAITQALNSQTGQLKTQELDIRNEIQTVPDDAVNGRFRLALERARSAEREQAANTR